MGGALVPKFTIVVEDLAHLSNEELQARSLAAFQKLALWLLRDARHAGRFRRNLPHWERQLRRATEDARETSQGMRAFSQLVRYVWAVAGELRFHEFHAKMREHVPESEELIMTIEEELIQKGMEEGMADVLSE